VISLEQKHEQRATSTLALCPACGWSRGGESYGEIADAVTAHRVVCVYRSLSKGALRSGWAGADLTGSPAPGLVAK
jgi:hypothetical protein